jgi:small subunit ribosomal protein S1
MEITNPPIVIPARYVPGLRVRGRVVAIAPFGAFMEFEPGVRGLLLIVELGGRPVRRPSDLLAVGDEREVVVLHVDGERWKMSVSLRRLADEVGSAIASGTG